MFGRKPKVSNPKIKAFEKNLKQRRLLLVKDSYYCSSVYIDDLEEFLTFAVRSKVDTIFKYTGLDEVYYFYAARGVLFTTHLEKKVKAK